MEKPCEILKRENFKCDSKKRLVSMWVFCSEERAVQLLNKIEGYGLQEKSYYYIRNRGAGMSFFGGDKPAYKWP